MSLQQRMNVPQKQVHQYGCRNVSRRPADLRVQAQASTRQQISKEAPKMRLLSEKHRLHRSDREIAEIEAAVGELEALNSVENVDFTGSVWGLAYTTSTSTSSGQFGPFLGEVLQEFPMEKPGQYINKVDFKILKAELLGNYEKVGTDRIDLEFLYAKFQIGPFHFKRDFPPNFKGFWKLKYVDDQLRVFSTNQGNTFVLKKVA